MDLTDGPVLSTLPSDDDLSVRSLSNISGCQFTSLGAPFPRTKPNHISSGAIFPCKGCSETAPWRRLLSWEIVKPCINERFLAL